MTDMITLSSNNLRSIIRETARDFQAEIDKVNTKLEESEKKSEDLIKKAIEEVERKFENRLEKLEKKNDDNIPQTRESQEVPLQVQPSGIGQSGVIQPSGSSLQTSQSVQPTGRISVNVAPTSPVSNGNILEEDVKVIQLNTGNGPAKVSNIKVLDAINENDAKVVILSESNIDTSNDEEMANRESCFSTFAAEDKTFDGNSKARISMLIHKSLEYRRRKDLENNINCTIVVQIRRSKRKWTNIIGSYRQWTVMSLSCNLMGGIGKMVCQDLRS